LKALGRQTRSFLFGWFALVVVLAGYWGLAALDRGLKIPRHPGFSPANAAWVCTAPDLPQFWRRLGQAEPAAGVAEELPQWVHKCDLAVRQATGIRPTPSRWQIWMGSQVLASGGQGRWGLCVRPGVLLRLAHTANRLVPWTHGPAGLSRYGEFYYGWRDGYLLASKWPQYVQDALGAPAYAPPPQDAADALTLAWSGPRAGHLRVHAADGLPLTGSIAAGIAAREHPLHLPEAWPEPPLAVAAVNRWQDLAEILGALGALLPSLPAVAPLQDVAQSLCTTWGFAALPPDWDASLEECAVALLAIDTTETTPVPEMAVVWRGGPVSTHPWQTLVDHTHALPYVWNTWAGHVLPVLGEKATLCLARDDRYWVAASQEPVMDRLLGRWTEARAVQADLSVRVNWEQAGQAAGALLRRAAQLELVPRMNAREAEGALAPVAHAISTLGRLEIDGHAERGALVFDGFLARHKETPP